MRRLLSAPSTITQDGAPTWAGRSIPHRTSAASGGGRYWLAGVFVTVFAAIAGGLFALWIFALLVAYIMVP